MGRRDSESGVPDYTALVDVAPLDR
jgi:hypothetical protein